MASPPGKAGRPLRLEVRMNWVLAIGIAWAVIALIAALVLGHGMRRADRKDAEAGRGLGTNPPSSDPPGAGDDRPQRTTPPARPSTGQRKKAP
jgi:hypothetical protein